MKVYMKKAERQSVIPGIVFMTVFMGGAAILFGLMIQSGSMDEAIKRYGIAIPFAVMLGGAGLRMFIGLFEPAKTYSAKLIEKEIVEQNGKTLTRMVFQTPRKKESLSDIIPTKYPCYSAGSNELEKEKVYEVKIKRFNHEIKEVVTEKAVDETQELKKMDSMAQIVPLIIGILPVSLFVLSVYGMVSKGTVSRDYLIVLLASIGLGVWAILGYRQWKKDEQKPGKNVEMSFQKMEQQEATEDRTGSAELLDNVENEKGNIPRTDIPVGHPSVRNMILEIASVVGVLVIGLGGMVLKAHPSQQELKETIFPFAGMVLGTAAVWILFALYGMGANERKMKKWGISKGNIDNVSSIQKFKVRLAGERRAFVTDAYDQLLFIVEGYGSWIKKFVVYDGERNLITKVRERDKLLGMEYQFDVDGEEPFTMRRRIQLNGYYDIEDLHYYVTGNLKYNEGSIVDEEGNELVCFERGQQSWRQYDMTVKQMQNTFDFTLIMAFTILGNHNARKRKKSH